MHSLHPKRWLTAVASPRIHTSTWVSVQKSLCLNTKSSQRPRADSAPHTPSRSSSALPPHRPFPPALPRPFPALPRIPPPLPARPCPHRSLPRPGPAEAPRLRAPLPGCRRCPGCGAAPGGPWTPSDLASGSGINFGCACLCMWGD